MCLLYFFIFLNYLTITGKLTNPSFQLNLTCFHHQHYLHTTTTTKSHFLDKHTGTKVKGSFSQFYLCDFFFWLVPSIFGLNELSIKGPANPFKLFRSIKIVSISKVSSINIPPMNALITTTLPKIFYGFCRKTIKLIRDLVTKVDQDRETLLSLCSRKW